MNAEEQQEIAERVEGAFRDAGILVEEPAPRELGGGFRFQPVVGPAWLKLVAWLTRSGYRLNVGRNE